jgi:hypothetical protein
MLLKSLSAFAVLLPATFACPHESHLYKRQAANQTIENPKWAYEASYNWGMVRVARSRSDLLFKPLDVTFRTAEFYH